MRSRETDGGPVATVGFSSETTPTRVHSSLSLIYGPSVTYKECLDEIIFQVPSAHKNAHPPTAFVPKKIKLNIEESNCNVKL